MRLSLLLLLVPLPGTVSGQPVAKLPMRPADASLETEFVGVTSMRELADGRVIITDGRDQQLYLADFTTRRSDLLGRKGRGPGEWLNVGFIYPTQGDSSLLGDFGNRRWLLFAGARIVGVMPTDHPAVQATGASIRGVDRLGHVMRFDSPPARPGAQVFTRRDSLAVTFVDRRSGRVDTVAKLRERPHRRDVVMNAEGQVTSSMPSATEPNAQAEQAVLFNDGWLAIVRLEPLRVDWRAPTGTWTLGRPLPLRPESVDARERQAIAERRAVARAEAKKFGLRAPTSLEFPTTLPVLTETVFPRQTLDGRLVVGRTPSARVPHMRYLVINRRGTIDGELTLGSRERLLGFGVRSVYVASVDDDDIQRVQRHPWP